MYKKELSWIVQKVQWKPFYIIKKWNSKHIKYEVKTSKILSTKRDNIFIYDIELMHSLYTTNKIDKYMK